MTGKEMAKVMGKIIKLLPKEEARLVIYMEILYCIVAENAINHPAVPVDRVISTFLDMVNEQVPKRVSALVNAIQQEIGLEPVT